jgi:subtilisin family serine protease
MNAHRHALGAAALAWACSGSAGAGVISDELAREMAQRRPDERIAVIIQLVGRVDPRLFEASDRRRRDTRLLRALQAHSGQALAQLAPRLDEGGALDRKPLWINNALAASVPVRAIPALARLAAVERIGVDAVVRLAPTALRASVSASPGGTPGWNLEALHVPALWAQGVQGDGVVVANMDTGVDLAHPDLAGRWRGGTNSWFDPWHEFATPADPNGHGTQTMGLAVAGSASGMPTGVAPGARWIAARVFDSAGQSTLSTIHLAFQWLLDPDGDPATVDAPDVVNASWGLTGGTLGACNMEFDGDIKALNAAGVAVVFAAGNDGPGPSTAASPAANPSAFSAGAVDATLAVTAASSRGPSGCDGSVFPKVVAPGANVSSSDLSFGGLPLYTSVSGTSFAAPHVTGTLALLAGAYPSATVGTLTKALTDSASDIDLPGPDNNAGHGLVDALAAHQLLGKGNGGQNPPVFTSLPPAEALENQLYQYQATASDPDGGTLAFALAAAPAGMTVGPASGRIAWTPTHAQLGSNAVTLVVTDPGGHGATQSFTVRVASANSLPVAVNDSYSVAAGATLTVATPGVLANDRDADGDRISAQLASAPAHGKLTLGADGAIRYVPAAGFAGADSFSYRGADAGGAGNVAVVALSVTAAPVAAADSFSAPVFRAAPYSPQRLALLANDSAASGATLVPSSVTLLSAPDHGGKAVVNSDGTVSYTPPQRFAGVETFRYRVRDSNNTWSGSATVSVRVN